MGVESAGGSRVAAGHQAEERISHQCYSWSQRAAGAGKAKVRAQPSTCRAKGALYRRPQQHAEATWGSKANQAEPGGAWRRRRYSPICPVSLYLIQYSFDSKHQHREDVPDPSTTFKRYKDLHQGRHSTSEEEEVPRLVFANSNLPQHRRQPRERDRPILSVSKNFTLVKEKDVSYNALNFCKKSKSWKQLAPEISFCIIFKYWSAEPK